MSDQPRAPRGAWRNISRRNFLRGSGIVVIGFSLAGCVPTAQNAPTLDIGTPEPTPEAPPTAVATEVAEQAPVPTAPAVPAQATPGPAAANVAEGAGRPAADQVDAWLAVSRDNRVTIYSGRVELGTGVRTALAQIAADELDVSLDRVSMVMGDTQQTPDEGYTAGSKTIQVGGVVVRQAAAQARAVLMGLAAAHFGVSVDQLAVSDGTVSVIGDASRQVTYGELIGDQRFSQTVDTNVTTKSPDQYSIVGQSVPRFDLPDKIAGRPSYVQDMRLPDMLHGRVIRPAGLGATLVNLDESSVQDIPGVRVVRNGNFVGVGAEQEWQAIQAAQRLKVQWQLTDTLPDQASLYDVLRAANTEDRTLLDDGDVEGALTSAAAPLQARYQTPYQTHGSIGPSSAVADVRADQATVWSSTQGVYPLRGALAQLIGMDPEKVHVVHVEGSGCYGHNGFDDAAGDAVLLSRAVGKPVRVQWMRQDEHGWDPKGPAMVMEVRGAVDDQGKVAAWDFGVWTPTHSTRPGGMAANLLPGQLIEPAPPAANNGFVGGDRNAKTNYTFENNRVVAHWLTDSPLRPSALRSLGGGPNTFANESFMDELAAAASADPVDFRLRHLSDDRARAVIQAAAQKAGWQSRPSPRSDQVGEATPTGRGIAFSRYENNEAYTAVVAEVQVDRGSGQVRLQRLVVAQDAGLIINPDGMTNQLEGNLIQASSRALKEEITFDRSRVTSVDWASYPILTFPEIPSIDVVLINHPDQPAYGSGEPSTLPVAPAIANAIFDATGARVRTIPLTPNRVMAALASVSTA